MPNLDPFVNGAACNLLFFGPPASIPINPASMVSRIVKKLKKKIL